MNKFNRKTMKIDTAVLLAAVSFILTGVTKLLLHFIGNTVYISAAVRMGLTSVISMSVPILLFCYGNIYRKYKSTDNKSKSSAGFSVVSVLFGFGCCTGLNFIISLIRSIAKTENTYGASYNDMCEFFLMILCAGILPAVLEELLFRGCILTYLREYGILFSIVLSSLLFSMIHSGPANMIFAIAAGMILGTIRIVSENIAVPITVHLLNNVLALSLTAANSFLSEEWSSLLFYLTGIIGIAAAAALLPLMLKAELPGMNLRRFIRDFKAVLSSKLFCLFIAVVLLMTVLG